MTFRIKATELVQHKLTAGQYRALVEYHAQELVAWHAHMAQVAATAHLPQNIPDPDQAPQQEGEEGYVQRFVHHPEKYQPFPRPVAPAFIDDAVDSMNLLPDYEIEDDLPTSEELLAKRKEELRHQVSVAERAAMDKIMPVGKQRLANLTVGKAFAKEPENRTDDDKKLIEEHVARTARYKAVEAHGAQLTHDIEDLTSETIDAWAMTPFPE